MNRLMLQIDRMGNLHFKTQTLHASADSLLKNDLIRPYISFPDEINLPCYVN